MFRLFYYECVKTFSKKRTWLGFLIVALVIPLITIAMSVEGERFLSRAVRLLQQDFFFVGSLYNGWFAATQLMNSLWIHIPLLISFVAGDQLAGEATLGTYRLILTRPVSRFKIFLVKYLTVLFYTILFISMLGALSVSISLALLGGGDFVIIYKGILILPESEAPGRFLLAFALAAVSMVTIASISFFFSSFVENAIGPIVSTMGLLIIAGIISAFPLEIFEYIRPYLFTTYLNVWQMAFTDPIDWDAIATSVGWLTATSAAFVGAAYTIFARRDILT